MGDAARKVEEELSSFKDAFDFGVAQGFIQGLAEQFKLSDDALGNLTVAGAQFGYVLGVAFGDALTAIQTMLPYVHTLTLAFEEAADVMTGRWGAAVDRMIDLGNAFAGTGKVLQTDLLPGLQKFTLAMEEQLRNSKDVNDTWKTTVTVSDEWAEAMRALPGIIRATNSPLEKYRKQIEQISFLQTNTKLTSEEAAKAQQNAVIGVADTYISAAGQITSTLAGAFQDQKGFAIANAVVNVAEGVTRALALPFPLNWIQAGAVAAAGAAQIAAIESAKPGSASKASVGSSGGGGGGGGAAPAAAAPGVPGALPGAADTFRSLHVSFQGNMFSQSQMRDLAAQLIEFQRDGGKIIVD